MSVLGRFCPSLKPKPWTPKSEPNPPGGEGCPEKSLFLSGHLCRTHVFGQKHWENMCYFTFYSKSSRIIFVFCVLQVCLWYLFWGAAAEAVPLTYPNVRRRPEINQFICIFLSVMSPLIFPLKRAGFRTSVGLLPGDPLDPERPVRWTPAGLDLVCFRAFVSVSL